MTALIFAPDLAPKVLTGKATLTRRLVSDNPRSPWHPDNAPRRVGRRIAVRPGRTEKGIGTVLIVKVKLEDPFYPASIPDYEARRHGFDDAAGFIDFWKRTHGSVLPRAVWRVELGLPKRGRQSWRA